MGLAIKGEMKTLPQLQGKRLPWEHFCFHDHVNPLSLPLVIVAALPAPARLGGLLGRALESSQHAHLAQFISSPSSPAIALFGSPHVCCNHEGDWYGEHAGKWLVAAARNVRRTGDATLRNNVRSVADFLVGQQEADGYLGTYAPPRRFVCRQGPAPLTWDGAPAQRTWDIWVHSYLILGLLETARSLGDTQYVAAAARIGDLCCRTFLEAGIPITSLGNHHGLSATVLLDPAVELFFVTGESRYLDLAHHILAAIETSPAINLVEQLLAGTDLANISTGKAYQLCWNLVGVAKLHRATGDSRLRRAVEHAWQNIREHHLTLGGGPWGGVAHRSREVFNPQSIFSPWGYVETCSTLAWIQLNAELLLQTGEARFAEEIERSAYNDLLGAQAPAGDNWCYYSFPNGRRVHTTYWRCCKSSGPMALEELPLLAYSTGSDGLVSVNLYGPGEIMFDHPQAGQVHLQQETDYPFDGTVRLALTLARPARFDLRLCIPAWAEDCSVQINGEPAATTARAGTYFPLHREWHSGDVVTLQLPMRPQLHYRTHRNIQESRAPDGSPVRQQVLHFDYAAVTRGPLVYATGLIDGFKTEETLRLPPQPRWELLPPANGGEGPALRLELGYREALVFQPYFEAGGREDGKWRLTWMQLPPPEAR